jgi:hypothetical protein
MSLQQTVNKVINDHLQKFFERVTAKHSNISKKELEELWNSSEVLTQSSSDVDDDCPKFLAPPTDITHEYLLKCLKPELVGLCKKYNVKTTGTKNDLLAALREKLFSNKTETEETTSITTKPTSSAKKTVEPPVIKKLSATIPTVAISRNKFGNHEHTETSFIFDKKSKKVIGKQNPDGSIDELTEDDINLCNKHKFEYVLPNNLDKNAKNNATIDELDDEEIVESDDDLDEDELLEEEEELDEDDADFDDY